MSIKYNKFDFYILYFIYLDYKQNRKYILLLNISSVIDKKPDGNLIGTVGPCLNKKK